MAVNLLFSDNDSSEDELKAVISDSDDEIIFRDMFNRRPRWIRERENFFNDYDDRDFEIHFRLRKSTALFLLEQIEEQLEFQSDKNEAISPINQLLMTLRFYATGSTHLQSGDFSGFSKSSAHRIVHRVSSAIASLRDQYIIFPESPEERREAEIGFYNIAKFPKVIGALDCTHIKIANPGGDDGELYRNRKGYFSLNVQAICNSKLKFTDIVARWAGSTHDSHIFNNCNRRVSFERGDYGDSVLVGDAGYGSRIFMMIPLEDPVTAEENLYNESQIRTRNPIERLFGVWKRRFPVLALGMRVHLKNVFPIIVATAVLHNILRDVGEDLPPDDPNLRLPAPWEALLSEGEMNENAGHPAGNRQDAARQSLIDNYFRSLLKTVA